MLSKEDNEILTRVGPGTLMGNLLRRYWIPACLTSEIPEPDGAPVRVRLLGEDLVAFRDTNGAVGLIEEQCPHRGASLFFGRNYWISDPYSYRLPPSPPGTQWIRYYDDVVLVDVYSGEVLDVIYDFFW